MADHPLFEPGRELLLARGYVREGRTETYVREVAPGITGLVWLNGAREALEWGRSLDVHGGPTVDYEAFAARLVAEIGANPGQR